MADHKAVGITECNDPRDFQDNYFGKLVTSEGIAADPEGYAEVFAEGSTELRELLLDMWGHGIETLGCCVGHADVPDFYKDTLHGKEWITEEEYNRYSKLFWYHRVLENAGGYFFFVVPDGYGGKKDRLQDLLECVRERLVHIDPELPEFRVVCEYNDFHECNIMRIDFNYLACKEDVERVFAGMHKVLGDVFEFNRELVNIKELEESEILSLDDVLSDAQSRVFNTATYSKEQEHANDYTR